MFINIYIYIDKVNLIIKVIVIIKTVTAVAGIVTCLLVGAS